MTANPVINIVIPQGSNFSETFVSTESNGAVSNLSGYSGVSRIKKHPEATTSKSFTVNITGGTGEVSIAMTSGITASLQAGRYYYDVKLTSSSGSVSRLVEGMAMVTAGIST
jgi:hypothetical protein